MRQFSLLSLALCLLFLPSIALADVTLVLRIQTSSPEEIRITSRVSDYLKQKIDLRAKVNHDTTIVAVLKPKEPITYTIENGSYTLSEWITLENGDSVVLTLDLGSGEGEIVFDKRGYMSTFMRANALYWTFSRKADSIARTKRFAQMRPYSYVLQREYVEAVQPMLDSLKGSGFYSVIKGWRDAFAYRIQLSQLRNPWSDSTKQLLCNNPFDFASFVKTDGLPPRVITSLISNWLQVLIRYNEMCQLNRNIDSLRVAFLHSLPVEERDLGFIVYADDQLMFRRDRRSIERLDSLRRVLVSSKETSELFDLMLQEVAELAEGVQAPEISLPDTNGNIRTLSELRGKVVLIDFWGTWCGPCRVELPFVDSLARDYTNTDLRILGVALEYRGKENWKKFIKENNLPGLHLYAEAQFNNDQVQNYQIAGVPSYFLIDRNGKIISPNAPRPSDPMLRELIDKALVTP